MLQFKQYVKVIYHDEAATEKKSEKKIILHNEFDVIIPCVHRIAVYRVFLKQKSQRHDVYLLI